MGLANWGLLYDYFFPIMWPNAKSCISLWTCASGSGIAGHAACYQSFWGTRYLHLQHRKWSQSDQNVNDDDRKDIIIPSYAAFLEWWIVRSPCQTPCWKHALSKQRLFLIPSSGMWSHAVWYKFRFTNISKVIFASTFDVEGKDSLRLKMGRFFPPKYW